MLSLGIKGWCQLLHYASRRCGGTKVGLCLWHKYALIRPRVSVSLDQRLLNIDGCHDCQLISDVISYNGFHELLPRRVPLVEQELVALPEHLISTSLFCRIHIAQCFSVWCIILQIVLFSFGRCIVSSLIYYTPRYEVVGGILVSPCPSVCPSICRQILCRTIT